MTMILSGKSISCARNCVRQDRAKKWRTIIISTSARRRKNSGRTTKLFTRAHMRTHHGATTTRKVAVLHRWVCCPNNVNDTKGIEGQGKGSNAYIHRKGEHDLVSMCQLFVATP